MSAASHIILTAFWPKQVPRQPRGIDGQIRLWKGDAAKHHGQICLNTCPQMWKQEYALPGIELALSHLPHRRKHPPLVRVIQVEFRWSVISHPLHSLSSLEATKKALPAVLKLY